MSNRVDRAIAEAGEAVDAVMPITARAFDGLQSAVDAACAEIDRLRSVNRMYVDKLKELYDHFDAIGDGAEDASYAERQALHYAAEITEVLDKAGAL